jgi:hypothetical protein
VDHRRPGPVERLAAAERRIEKAKALVVRQEILAARLAATGGDVTAGRALLEEMRSTLAEMYERRRRILAETATAPR